MEAAKDADEAISLLTAGGVFAQGFDAALVGSREALARVEEECKVAAREAAKQGPPPPQILLGVLQSSLEAGDDGSGGDSGRNNSGGGPEEAAGGGDKAPGPVAGRASLSSITFSLAPSPPPGAAGAASTRPFVLKKPLAQHAVNGFVAAVRERKIQRHRASVGSQESLTGMLGPSSPDATSHGSSGAWGGSAGTLPQGSLHLEAVVIAGGDDAAAGGTPNGGGGGARPQQAMSATTAADGSPGRETPSHLRDAATRGEGMLRQHATGVSDREALSEALAQGGATQDQKRVIGLF